jgi:hypothetical protein
VTHHVHLFISHSWSYSGHYNTLAGWIFGQLWQIGGVPIVFHDHSVPKDHPIHDAPTVAALRARIYERIAASHVVVIPTGMYANHSTWIGREIEGAAQYGRPILAVDPWGQQRTASVVAEAAAETVGWTKAGVVAGIWRLATR